ncbi:MAG: hypothetical protein P1U34_09480 [Coxiellaceae bacterium]|nr:hypothetical protein [Coxiellaceae bacterium]
MSKLSDQVWVNRYRYLYALGVGSTAFAAAFGNLYEYVDADENADRLKYAYTYATMLAVMAMLKAYCLPGRDLRCVEDMSKKQRSSSGESTPDSVSLDDIESTRDSAALQSPVADIDDELEPPQYYPLKYAYLATDHFTAFNNLAFMGNAIIQCIAQQYYATAEEAKASPLDIPVYTIAIYAAYYLLIDMPFISAIDGKTSHEEIFAANNPRPDKLTQCFKTAFGRKFLWHTKNTTRILGSLSHTAQEILPIITALNQFARLRDIYNSSNAYWLIAVAAFKVVSFATVFAQTYYYEGEEQVEAYDEKIHSDQVDAGFQVIDDEVPSRSRYAVDVSLKYMLPISPIAHAAAEALPWILVAQLSDDSAVRYTCYGLAAWSFVNELLGNWYSEYQEAKGAINNNINRYQTFAQKPADKVSDQPDVLALRQPLSV